MATKSKHHKTAAQRARDKAVNRAAHVPAVPRGDRYSALASLTMSVQNRRYVIAPHVTDDPAMTASTDSGATLAMTLRDPGGRLERALGSADEVQRAGVFLPVNGVVYALQSLESDGLGGLNLTWWDEVADRLSRFDSYMSMRRSERRTFPMFVQRMVDEARSSPYRAFDFYCPELGDRQNVPRPRGLGKHAVATTKQDAKRLEHQAKGAQGCTLTYYAPSAGGINGRAGGGAAGVPLYDNSWACAAPPAYPFGTIIRFAYKGKTVDVPVLDRGSAIQGNHFDLLVAPAKALGMFSAGKASARFQVVGRKRVGGPFANGKRPEGSEGSGGVTTVDEVSQGSSFEVTTVEPYVFKRGERNGKAETSWDCIGRYAMERNWRRWAFDNALWLVSDPELRAGAPSVLVNGDEGWLVAPPTVEWGARRPVLEARMSVLAERWGVVPGATVRVAMGDERDGVWVVAEQSGTMVGPVVEVTLRRPQESKREPANETKTETVSITGETDVGGGSGSITGEASDMKQLAKRIGGSLPYAWGGGHGSVGKPSRSIRPGETQVGYDCSGYVAAVLAAVGHGFRNGQTVGASYGPDFTTWGRSGKGNVYTVWWNYEHIWIEFADGSRADTSPHGCGSSGPRFRTCRRSAAGFNPRHYPGF